MLPYSTFPFLENNLLASSVMTLERGVPLGKTIEVKIALISYTSSSNTRSKPDVRTLFPNESKTSRLAEPVQSAFTV